MGKCLDKKLIDLSEAFEDICDTLDNIVKEEAVEGGGMTRPKREFISHEHWGDSLVKKGYLDSQLLIN